MNKREFLKDAILFFPAAGVLQALSCQAAAKDPAVPASPAYDPTDHWYGMGVDVDKCIGCNRCVEACKAENGVPDEPFYFRTWVERYSIHSNGETTVECISTKPAPVDQVAPEDPDVVRTFFVPKLCNQCAHPPCVQVCPVGATFQTKDGVVLVDEKRCIGCRYCIQACPYGARYLNPNTRTADKCTFCYHRITKDLLPACVQACPFGARKIGNLKDPQDPVAQVVRSERVAVLKSEFGTDPQAYYIGLDREVR
jgi:Fe-S-cluster-containing dehydrogenase component